MIAKLREISDFMWGWDDDSRKCSHVKLRMIPPHLCFADDDLDLARGRYPSWPIGQHTRVYLDWRWTPIFGILLMPLFFDWPRPCICFFLSFSTHVCVTRTVWIFNYSLSHGGGQIRLLACQMLDYFSKFPREHFVPQSLLFRPCSVPDFLAAAQKHHSLIGKETLFPH